MEHGPDTDVDLEAAGRIIKHLESRGMSHSDALAKVFSHEPSAPDP